MNKTCLHPKGSILIWTVLLGVMLSSVFLFSATRQSARSAMYRKVMVTQGRRGYLESYMGYLQSLNVAQLEDIEGEIDFDGITGMITNDVPDEITGVLDDGESVDYPMEGQVKVEWNLCSANEKGEIELNSELQPVLPDNCGSFSYQRAANVTPEGTLTLNSAFAPLHYRITPLGDTRLQDKDWTVNLNYKKLRLLETFTPQA